MSSGSGSGSGADQHLLALLRAIRLRQSAPDAVAAGIADTAAALTELRKQQPAEADPSGDPAAPSGDHPDSPPVPPVPPPPAGQHGGTQAVRPSWASPDATPVDEVPPGTEPSSRVFSDPATSDPASSGQASSGAVSPPPPDAAAVDAVAAHLSPKDFFGRPKKPAAPPTPGAVVPAPVPDDVPPAPPGSGPLHNDQPGAGGGAVLPATPGSSALSGGFSEGIDEAGRPNRNRFAGLSPAHKPPPADEHPRPVNRPVNEPAPPPGRPRWASSEHGNAIDGTVADIEPYSGPHGSGPHAPRVPGHETPHLAPPTGRAASAGDGMDPADDELLRDTQRLLSTSLTFAGGPDEVAERFQAALSQAHPALLAAIPGDADTQIRQLARAVTWLVHHLDRPPLLVDGCGRLGAALAACGVTPDQPQIIGAALAEAMRAGMPAGTWRQDFDVAWRSTWQHVHEWIRHGAVAEAYQPPIWTAAVVGHDLRRHDLAVVRLRPSLPMPFRPGQYARIEVPELPGIWRPYSLSGAPRRDDIIELHVRAKTQSGVSGTLVYRTEVGDQVRLGRPEGTMGLPATGRPLLMIAGDTGVAPLKALLTELADTGDPRSAVLFWGVRNLNELYDIKQITAIAQAAHRATVVPVVSEGNPGPYASGLVTDAVAAYGEWSNHEVYLAGPPLMLAATNAALYKLGVAPHHIHHDAPE